MLNELFDCYGSDKGSLKHDYGPVYELYMHQWRHEPIRLLEIGVRDGASLRAWRDYFPQAQIWGLDIDPRAPDRVPETSISVLTGDQSDDVDLARVLAASPVGFDVIIDDGSHVNDHIIKTFSVLFPHLGAGGLYVIEDLLESYHGEAAQWRTWPGMHFNKTQPDNERQTLMCLFERLMNDIDHGHGHVASIHFHRELVAIRKLDVPGLGTPRID